MDPIPCKSFVVLSVAKYRKQPKIHILSVFRNVIYIYIYIYICPKYCSSLNNQDLLLLFPYHWDIVCILTRPQAPCPRICQCKINENNMKLIRNLEYYFLYDCRISQKVVPLGNSGFGFLTAKHGHANTMPIYSNPTDPI